MERDSITQEYDVTGFSKYDVRGFVGYKFVDRYGSVCSVQESSLATEDAIWLGVDDAKPQILATVAARLGLDTHGQDCGWVPFAVPADVLLTTRMHLTRNQVAALLPMLQAFVNDGNLEHARPEDA